MAFSVFVYPLLCDVGWSSSCICPGVRLVFGNSHALSCALSAFRVPIVLLSMFCVLDVRGVCTHAFASRFARSGWKLSLSLDVYAVLPAVLACTQNCWNCVCMFFQWDLLGRSHDFPGGISLPYLGSLDPDPRLFCEPGFPFSVPHLEPCFVVLDVFPGPFCDLRSPFSVQPIVPFVLQRKSCIRQASRPPVV